MADDVLFTSEPFKPTPAEVPHHHGQHGVAIVHRIKVLQTTDGHCQVVLRMGGLAGSFFDRDVVLGTFPKSIVTALKKSKLNGFFTTPFPFEGQWDGGPGFQEYTALQDFIKKLHVDPAASELQPSGSVAQTWDDLLRSDLESRDRRAHVTALPSIKADDLCELIKTQGATLDHLQNVGQEYEKYVEGWVARWDGEEKSVVADNGYVHFVMKPGQKITFSRETHKSEKYSLMGPDGLTTNDEPIPLIKDTPETLPSVTLEELSALLKSEGMVLDRDYDMGEAYRDYSEGWAARWNGPPTRVISDEGKVIYTLMPDALVALSRNVGYLEHDEKKELTTRFALSNRVYNRPTNSQVPTLNVAGLVLAQPQSAPHRHEGNVHHATTSLDE